MRHLGDKRKNQRRLLWKRSSSLRAKTSRKSLRTCRPKYPIQNRAASGSIRTASYYVSESLVERATNIARWNLVSLGTCIAKFTHGGSLHLTVQEWNILVENAKHKVWLKPKSERSFFYGNHVSKKEMGRITESIAAGDGFAVYSLSDVPFGFGIAAKSTQDCWKMESNEIVVLRQADIGEYLRMEDEL